MVLTQQQVQELFEYRDGALYWKERLMSRNRPSVLNGKKIGTDNKNGYSKIIINKKKYYLHQLIYLYHYGFIPKNIDHKDGNGMNNKIENLREATVNQNMFNTKMSITNTSGTKGIHFNKQKMKWQAKIVIKGKQLARVFKSKEDAIDFMSLLREMTHGEFANHG
jgi:hypothetical protein